MKRGDLVTVAAKGTYTGKPRAALVVQSDLFSELGSVTLCLLTHGLKDAPLLRLPVEPTRENGLQITSQIMVDKLVTVRREQVGAQFGALDHETMVRVDRSLAMFLGIA
ncbi:MAG: type II toxin-antitoxin system PemK/MazF family toxin [Gammaproteobacteria bacterium]|nr:type II toxin-antitoxin system PemK/MazF family toxin [Gammaproteobacteria bacterium]